MRSTKDAIEHCFILLARKDRASWILEGDIKACFDNINHQWLMDNITTDKQVLEKWLKSGVIDKRFYSTDMGTPQGGVISPILANLTLNGMQSLVKDLPKVNIVSYADDFVVTAYSKEILLQAQTKIEAFLNQRGLQLSSAKTAITHINEGFDFLGFNIRKYKGKLLTKPAKESVKSFLKEIRDIVNSHKTAKTNNLIHLLNPKIRGWANYYRSGVAGATFNYVNMAIFQILLKWIKRRHPNKNVKWMKSKYFKSIDLENWVFCDKSAQLINMANISIVRHRKIKSYANPYNTAHEDYFKDRLKKR